MHKYPGLLLLLSAVLATTACNFGPPLKIPPFKHNPHPHMRYELTVTIADAPGPFDAVFGDSTYQVLDNACEPLDYWDHGGGTPDLDTGPRIALEQIDERTYRGFFYTDLMQDEDYFGLGVCHWQMTLATVYLGRKEAMLDMSLQSNDISGQTPVTRYFSSREYNYPKWVGSMSGNPKASDFTKDAGSIFSVTLVSKEVTQ